MMVKRMKEMEEKEATEGEEAAAGGTGGRGGEKGVREAAIPCESCGALHAAVTPLLPRHALAQACRPEAKKKKN